MANLQIANKCNLFSYSFAEENKEICQKLKELHQKPIRFWQKTQGFEKNSRVWGPVGPTGPPKSAQKTSLNYIELLNKDSGCCIVLCS